MSEVVLWALMPFCLIVLFIMCAMAIGQERQPKRTGLLRTIWQVWRASR